MTVVTDSREDIVVNGFGQKARGRVARRRDGVDRVVIVHPKTGRGLIVSWGVPGIDDDDLAIEQLPPDEAASLLTQLTGRP